MKPRSASAALAAILLVVAASLGYVSVRRVQRQVTVGEICNATSESRWQDALAHGDGVAGPDLEGRIAAECLCWAYASQDRLGDCAKLIDRVLADPKAHDWVPDITLARLVVRERREQGRFEEAAQLARRANHKYPTDTQLLEAEMLNRTVFEDELAVLRDMETRLSDDLASSLALRLVIAAGYERRGDYARTLEILADTPPPEKGPAQTAWFEGRAGAHAGLQRRDDLKKTYDTWQAMGGDPVEMQTRYAIRVSMFGLSDPEHSRTELLELAMQNEEELPTVAIRRTLYERLIGHYLVEGRVDDALATYDRAKTRLDDVLISREEIIRSASKNGLAELQGGGRANVLVFRTAPDAPAGTLHLSPDKDVALDSAYEAHALRPGRDLRVERHPDLHPQRWVFRDAEGRTRASGTAWSDRAETVIDVRPEGALEPQRFEPVQAAGDGRRRVFVVIPDCEDWRLLQYLRTRGEAPVHDALLARGYRAVLYSSPAFTGAAMESLVWPTRDKHVTFLGLVNRLGIEIGGLSSVGKNPFEFLKTVLPEGENLFERIGAGPHVTANLLFSHGYIDAGENAQLIGPDGQRRQVGQLQALRPLRPEESRDLPPVLKHQRAYRAEVEKMAAELDTAQRLAASGEVDLLMIRIEPLDILTHTFFTEMMRSEQDDGSATLLWAYRYLDRRLGEIWQALDADDVFIVMSDHGIRTALEHDEAAVFVAVGAGVPTGRASGNPHLKGIPHLLADLLGVQTGWPDTQIAAWAEPATSLPASADRTQSDD